MVTGLSYLSAAQYWTSPRNEPTSQTDKKSTRQEERSKEQKRQRDFRNKPQRSSFPFLKRIRTKRHDRAHTKRADPRRIGIVPIPAQMNKSKAKSATSTLHRRPHECPCLHSPRPPLPSTDGAHLLIYNRLQKTQMVTQPSCNAVS